MNSVYRSSEFSIRPIVDAPPRKGYGTLMVLLALGALAWLVYYLYKKSLILSERAQAIRDSFRHCPPHLLPEDLDKAARVVETLENQAQSIRNSLRITADKTVRFQIKLFSYFDLLSPIKKKLIIELGPRRTWYVQCIISKLGRGSYGKVVQLFDLHTGRQTAFKIATPAKEMKNNPTEWSQANQDLNKEHKNLMTVHQRGIPPPGIQDKPLSLIIILIKITSSLMRARLAYEGTVYSGSLDKLVFQRHLSFKARLNIALQVLRGLEILHKQKLIHHDLKLQNILFRQSPTDLQVHVSDLGGVTHEDKIPQQVDSGGIAHTPAYTNSFRLSLASVMPTDRSQTFCVQKAEECSVGLTLCSILTGREVTKEGYDENYESIWSRIQNRKKYESLISKIDNYIRRNIVISFFNANITELKETVEKFHRECTT